MKTKNLTNTFKRPFDLLVMCFKRNDKEEEIPYRVTYEPSGLFKNNDGSFTACTLKKSHGYWGNTLKVEVEKTVTRI